jgi:8-oxo-dGTP pyrophosphatase MutT (NUDIX family)
VRETLEETGLVIGANGIIGSRVHPVTGVPIVYVAAVSANRACALAGPCGELAEVRWVGAAEASELISGMFGLVREYLRSKLRG